ncbi:MAG: hypothetical protein COW01_08780 [Bdellovibrionales bacterium CG12_big_fil_rev_8_21_14_0_65_38_15]|nr:MAG: hypothetical protein COW79_04535 [Bdellovibrionales bacterium CG22_combo_CG10-13_8_21_14_all_38_13]PIQ55042.1 MAG: hypothetical protein COW01_08780 [Bdellovibrionales bacterium CG12_big_fil_rev_8_21_14_0_65_38_15]
MMDVNISQALDLFLNDAERSILLGQFPNGIVAIDLETTGISPLVDKIIEIAAIKFTPQGVSSFETLINPEIDIPAFTTDIHGITDAMVKDQPVICEVLPQFADFIGDLPLVAHNAKFDLGFLVFDYHQLKMPLPRSQVVCSCLAARKSLRQVENHKLGTLCRELNIPLINHHRASDDAWASLSVLAKSLVAQKEHAGKVHLGDALMFKAKDFEKNKDMEIPTHLRILTKKVRDKHVIDIKYKGGSSRRGEYRPVRALSLLPMPGGNVLYAHCLLSDMMKSFSLKKITDVRDLDSEEIRDRLAHFETIKKDRSK